MSTDQTLPTEEKDIEKQIYCPIILKSVKPQINWVKIASRRYGTVVLVKRLWEFKFGLDVKLGRYQIQWTVQAVDVLSMNIMKEDDRKLLPPKQNK